MKAITIWQPWAEFIAAGVKHNETRSWATKYRGPIAIHAAVKHISLLYWTPKRLSEIILSAVTHGS